MNRMVVEIDLGDKQNCVCVLDNEGAVMHRSKVTNTVDIVICSRPVIFLWRLFYPGSFFRAQRQSR